MKHLQRGMLGMTATMATAVTVWSMKRTRPGIADAGTVEAGAAVCQPKRRQCDVLGKRSLLQLLDAGGGRGWEGAGLRAVKLPLCPGLPLPPMACTPPLACWSSFRQLWWRRRSYRRIQWKFPGEGEEICIFRGTEKMQHLFIFSSLKL